MSNMYNVKPN